MLPRGRAESVPKDIETEKVWRERKVGDASHGVSVAQPPGTAHFAQERLHHFKGSLNVDEDRPVRSVSHRTDHPVAKRSFGHASPVVHSLDTADRDAVPVYEGVHDFSRSEPLKVFPVPSEQGGPGPLGGFGTATGRPRSMTEPRGARGRTAPGRSEPDEKPSLKRKRVFSDV